MTGQPVASSGAQALAAPDRGSGPSCAIVVVSCDRYADLWAPFFTLWERFWPERFGPTYLVTNHAHAVFRGVKVIRVGDDVSWSDNLLKALSDVPEEYILLSVEDLFLCGPVDAEYLRRILDWVRENRPDHVRLNPSERPYRKHDDTVGWMPEGAPYRTSTVLTLWKKAVLASLLRSGESAWEFELLGSGRSDQYRGFYSAKRKVFPVINGVIKGKWQPIAVRRLKTLGIQVDRPARPVMNGTEALRFLFHLVRSRVFKLVPWSIRRGARALLTGRARSS